MIKLITLFILSSVFIGNSQEIDSLKILTQNDWKLSHWFQNDTVCFLPKKKLDTIYEGLTEAQILKKKKKYIFSERIRFKKNGAISYINNLFCPVGESIKRAHSFTLDNNVITIDFETIKWPWKKNKMIREKKRFKVLELNSNKFKIIKCQ